MANSRNEPKKVAEKCENNGCPEFQWVAKILDSGCPGFIRDFYRSRSKIKAVMKIFRMEIGRRNFQPNCMS
jgi:hypothetical protein